MSLLPLYGYEREHPEPQYESLIYGKGVHVLVYIHESEEILVK